jgi:coenzyme F420-0:L-glutamate ligase/coenzyme F420-1:gamma-L-glutamate ligase
VKHLTFTALAGIPMIQTGNDLAGMIFEALEVSGIQLRDGDVLVLAQKIVSKAEDRWVDLEMVVPGDAALALAEEIQKDPRLVEMILSESREIVRRRPGLVIVEHRLGFICANAGIDHSNVKGKGDWVLLLPEDPDASAEDLRRSLCESAGVEIGVLIIDSHGRAWRNGTVGITIGIAGLPGVVDRRGETDLFGYKMVATEVGAADELAAGASLLMGQVDEATPVVHVRGFPYPLREAGLVEILRERERDMFR